MTVAALLSELRRRDIEVWIDGGQLRCRARPGALSGELVDELRQRKGEIVEFLHSAQALARQERAIVPLQQNGALPPMFAVPGHNGDVFCYRALARALGDGQPLFGLQPPGVDGRDAPLERVEDIAAYFARQIGTFLAPGKPCVIGGFCAGGAVAYELAQQLARSGREVRVLALFGCQYPSFFRAPEQLRWRLGRRAQRWAAHWRALQAADWAGRARYFTARLRKEQADPGLDDPVVALRRRVELATVRAVRRYRPEPYQGRVALFVPSTGWISSSARRWRSVAKVEEYAGPEGCDGDNMLREPHAAVFAEFFRRVTLAG